MEISSRDRILQAARCLFQRQGYAATGISEILTMAKLPKGVLYHHFPGGKGQIGEDAIDQMAVLVLGWIAKLRTRNVSAAQALIKVGQGMADWLTNREPPEGCLVGAIAAEILPSDHGLRAACQRAFDQWRAAFAELMVKDGIAPERAARLSNLAIATLEGSLLLGRTDQNAQCLIEATEEVAAMIEAAALQAEHAKTKPDLTELAHRSTPTE